MTPTPNLTFASVTLNSPDPQALGRFYARLLGWEITIDEAEWVMLRNPDGGVGINMQREDIYVRPTWPATPGEQQMQLHLEIQVTDLDAACTHARECGAEMADYQPQEDVRVHLDPDGHPFCLYL